MAWTVIEALLPGSGGRNGRWRDHRQVINGILWKLRTGAPWRDLPDRYGPWKTCHERPTRWTGDGTWDKILAAAVACYDGQPVEWVISVVGTVSPSFVSWVAASWYPRPRMRRVAYNQKDDRIGAAMGSSGTTTVRVPRFRQRLLESVYGTAAS
jgi:transposase